MYYTLNDLEVIYNKLNKKIKDIIKIFLIK